MKTLITTVSESDDDTDLEFQVDTDSASEGRGGDVGKEEKADIWARIGRRESLEKAFRQADEELGASVSGTHKLSIDLNRSGMSSDREQDARIQRAAEWAGGQGGEVVEGGGGGEAISVTVEGGGGSLWRRAGRGRCLADSGDLVWTLAELRLIRVKRQERR